MNADELLSLLYTADCAARGGRQVGKSPPITVLSGADELPIAAPAITLEGGGAAPRYVALHVQPLLDARELATVLAALRLWQISRTPQRAAWASIATNEGSLLPLTDTEVDLLCERLNSRG